MRYFYFLLALLISQITFADNKRLVSIDGSLTEIIYALGAQTELVAVDSTSVYPSKAKELPNVGYMRALSAEGILSIKPTRVITSSSAGPKNVLEQIKAAGVEVNVIHASYSLLGLTQKINDVGVLLDKKSQAEQLNKSIDNQLKPLIKKIDAQKKAPKTLFFLGMQGNQLMAAGSGTQAQALLDILKAENAMAASKGYKPLSKESIISINPEAVIVAIHAPMDHNKIKAQFQHTKAFVDNKIMIIDSARALGFGPRLVEALAAIVNVIYS